MGTLADLLIPLAGSISNENALAMRKACDALEKRIEMLESATKHTGEGSTSQTGAVSHSQSGGGSDGTREPARSARIDDAGTTQDTPSPDFTVKPCPCGAPARIRQADNDWMISCTDIACDWCIGGGLYASKEDMLRAWNRRAPAAPRNTPSPASVPEWVPSETELEALWRTHPVGGEFAAMRRLIASRAPAAPVVDVWNLLLAYYDCHSLDKRMSEDNVDAMTRALAAQGIKCKEVQP